ncbi:hypothetical protein NHL50_11560 [Acidimicrobiia bacterium EGI L10123]|uniref:hypothetical protein n=1 Tax=Salinilacustrithrix flava TaxID=2957203 RepID=UPI003D7C17FA|nr:hypothetical protein [Acidimicrobiia bacterium EGI L10123]
MLTLRYRRDELMEDHDYAEPQVIAGRRMHGGFLADGSYQPPRTKVRGPAIDAWTKALRDRGGELFDADASLLDGVRLPNVAQQRVLLRNGLGETFWNNLTIIGKIEAKGRLLADITFPDLQDVIVEDISEMAIGHLNEGLLVAHGLDEGGLPDQGIGGHDEMWFVARDLAFGAGAHPDVDPPENIARPDDERRIPELRPEIEGLVSFLANLLLIEFRAELGFSETQAVLRTPDLWGARAEKADEAADIIGRIRTDEEIHVSSLRLYLGEIRACTFRTVDGGTISGAEVIDRFWHDLVRWAVVDKPALEADQQRRVLEERIRAHAEADRVLQEFDAAAA